MERCEADEAMSSDQDEPKLGVRRSVGYRTLEETENMLLMSNDDRSAMVEVSSEVNVEN